MNIQTVAGIVIELSVLPYFPSNVAARAAIVRMVGEMCSTEDQVCWLVRLMTSGTFKKWEGPAELRAVFCMKFKPRDGIESISEVYPDGMTHEQLNPGAKMPALESAPLRQLAAGDPISADEELVAIVVDAAERMPHFRVCKTVSLRDGENDYQALLRQIEERRSA